MDQLDTNTPLGMMRAVTSAALRYRDSKNFAACTWDTLPARMCSLQVEIGELAQAIEVFDGDKLKARALRAEFADVTLYPLTMLYDLATWEWSVRERYHGAPRNPSSALETVQPIRTHWDQCISAWQKDNRRDAVIALELILAAAAQASIRFFPQIVEPVRWSHYGPLAHACFEKLDAMADRPAQHGKRAEA